MKYCTHCGKELLDEAVICPGCGCAAEQKASAQVASTKENLLEKLASRVRTNGIIWLVIGCLQILGGMFLNWYLLIVGALNIVSSVQDLNFSGKVQKDPKDIVKRFEPLAGPIIVLVYNLVIGGIIGVAGSIYYFVAVRNFVMENKSQFDSMNH